MEDIVASFQETIETNKEGVSGEFPGSVGLGFIFKVEILEFGADINDHLQFVAGFFGLTFFNHVEDSSSADEVSSLSDDGVTDFSDEDNKSWRGVVVLGVFPDHKDGVHDGKEEFVESGEVGGIVGKFQEMGFENLEIFEIIVGFIACCLDFFLEFGKSVGVSRFALFEEFEDPLDSFRLKLLMNRIQVFAFLFPEINFSKWVRIVSCLKSLFWFKLQDVLDLASPCDNGA